MEILHFVYVITETSPIVSEAAGIHKSRVKQGWRGNKVSSLNKRGGGYCECQGQACVTCSWYLDSYKRLVSIIKVYHSWKCSCTFSWKSYKKVPPDSLLLAQVTDVWYSIWNTVGSTRTKTMTQTVTKQNIFKNAFHKSVQILSRFYWWKVVLIWSPAPTKINQKAEHLGCWDLEHWLKDFRQPCHRHCHCHQKA